ncbi:MAG: PDZ domain-containing protein [Oscillospiraceae bacterium]
MSTIITSIDPGSPAMRAGLQPGQQLLSINGHAVVDVLDYRFYGYDPVSHLSLKNKDGSTQKLTIHKAEGEDLGLNFDSYLMDEDALMRQSLHLLLCRSDAPGYAPDLIL